MLPHSSRLRKQEMMGILHPKVPFFGSSFLTLKVRKSSLETTSPKFGVVVSKKLTKKAHERIYMRRVLFAAIREVLKEQSEIKNGLEGFHIGVIPKKQFFSLDFKVQKSEVTQLLQKVLKSNV